jgi:hypothetical protein
VAHADGVSAADTRSRKVTALRGSKGVALTGLRRIRWHEGTLIALQDDGNGAARLVRIRINGGGTVATSIDRLDDSSAESGSALTIAGNTAYYVAAAADGQAIRRVPLR